MPEDRNICILTATPGQQCPVISHTPEAFVHTIVGESPGKNCLAQYNFAAAAKFMQIGEAMSANKSVNL